SFRPLYEQIKVLLTQSLIAGEWHPGDAIPSEHELAARFKVSQGTVRKAIDELAAENILIRRQGKGTFVATHNEEGIKLRFLRLTAVDGKKELLENQMVSFARGKAQGEVAKMLRLKGGTSVTEVKRLLTFSGRPVILDHIIIPTNTFKGITATKIQEKNGSMYSMYETEFKIRMVRAEERLKAVAADAETAKLLGIKQGTPLLRIERVSYTYGDVPMEWRLGLCITDDHHYMNELE
ncbi:MAG TPA: GntR family transcriptional regulator, partial [Methylophilaceae bacterium]|nr:GntR family transcriptional regulator [Methylophilaceae bacterium]